MFGKHGPDAMHRRTTRTRSRWGLVVVLSALVVVTTQSAEAYWTSTGTTTGSGATGTSLPLTMAPGAPSTQLRPGGAAGVAVTISNPNPEPVHLASMVLDASQGTGGFSLDPAHSTCDTTALAFAGQFAGWMVPARSGTEDGTVDVVLDGAITMAVDAAGSCQGARFTVHLMAGS